MNDMQKLVQERRSVRTYDGHPLTRPDKEKLGAYMKTIENPYGLPIEFRMLEGMGCPVVVGTELYVGAKMNQSLHLNEAFGYSFEQLVLYAQSLEIGRAHV